MEAAWSCDVHFSAKQLLQVLEKSDLVKGSSFRIKVDQKIDVAPSVRLIPRHGTEDSGIPGLVLPKRF